MARLPRCAQMSDRMGASGSGLYRIVERLERWPPLDVASDVLSGMGQRMIGSGRAKDALSGTWLGHALHPMLTDFPLGTWMSASLLDLLGGRAARGPARRLVGLGVLAALPAAASGVSDWLDTRGRERRVGVVHAATNTTALGLYAASFVARHRGGHGKGVALGLAGGVTATVGGYLGGHLSLSRGVGVDHTAFEQGPTDWTPLPGLAPEEAMGTMAVDGVELLLAVDDGALFALSDRCTHRGGPLHEGVVAGGCVTCPWHGSRFRLADGSLAKGPAATPAPSYDLRRRQGGLEVRRREAVGRAATRAPGSEEVGLGPPIESLDELCRLVEHRPSLFVRYSKGPEDDRRGYSRDHESGLDLPGLSVNPLTPERWWKRPLEDWLARQLCNYAHLADGSDNDRYGWLLEGRVVARGPDNEPLVEMTQPMGRLSDAVVEEAKGRYRQRFDVASI